MPVVLGVTTTLDTWPGASETPPKSMVNVVAPPVSAIGSALALMVYTTASSSVMVTVSENPAPIVALVGALSVAVNVSAPSTSVSPRALTVNAKLEPPNVLPSKVSVLVAAA